MNNGILTQSTQPVAMPYGLLGRPTPVPMPAVDYAFDINAADYIRRVEAADGRALELPVRLALDAFVRGCKSDGIWRAIKAACIMAGARTLAGALVPLAGTAPTNFNFVNGDYNRKAGLAGDGSTKYLNSGRNNSDDPQNSKHLSIFVQAYQMSASGAYIGGGRFTDGASVIGSSPADLWIFARCNNASIATVSNAYAAQGFIGTSRSNLSNTLVRVNSSGSIFNNPSAAPVSTNVLVFARTNFDDTGADTVSNARLSFYSIGEALDLALLDARVTGLMNTLAAVL